MDEVPVTLAAGVDFATSRVIKSMMSTFDLLGGMHLGTDLVCCKENLRRRGAVSV